MHIGFDIEAELAYKGRLKKLTKFEYSKAERITKEVMRFVTSGKFECREILFGELRMALKNLNTGFGIDMLADTVIDNQPLNLYINFYPTIPAFSDGDFEYSIPILHYIRLPEDRVDHTVSQIKRYCSYDKCPWDASKHMHFSIPPKEYKKVINNIQPFIYNTAVPMYLWLTRYWHEHEIIRRNFIKGDDGFMGVYPRTNKFIFRFSNITMNNLYILTFFIGALRYFFKRAFDKEIHKETLRKYSKVRNRTRNIIEQVKSNQIDYYINNLCQEFKMPIEMFNNEIYSPMDRADIIQYLHKYRNEPFFVSEIRSKDGNFIANGLYNATRNRLVKMKLITKSYVGGPNESIY